MVPEEAERVRWLYKRYLELGCVSKLKADLDQRGFKSKERVGPDGRKFGGTPYSRGALYQILQNAIYRGEIHHRGQIYQGEHEAIVSQELWSQTQERLQANNQARRRGLAAKAPSLLTGLLYDTVGNRFTPSHAVKNGKRYRYYNPKR